MPEFADLPPLFLPGPRPSWLDQIKSVTWPDRSGETVLIAVRRPVPHGQADPAVFFVPAGEVT